MGFFGELDLVLHQPIGELLPRLPIQVEPEVGDGDVVPVEQRVAHPLDRRRDVGHDLVTIEVEVDISVGASTLWAPHELAVEPARHGQVGHGEREVEL